MINRSAPSRSASAKSVEVRLKAAAVTRMSMTVEAKGRDLFIVDNSVSGWTALRYLAEWSDIAKAFDIATGYFEIGGLLALDEKWQRLQKIRILMGAEMTLRTRKAILDAVRLAPVMVVDQSTEA